MEDETTDDSSPKIQFKASQIGLQTSTTAATDGGGDESSKFDVIFGINGMKPMESTVDFNPFDDITNEIYTPFLHYASIPPPPESFKEDTIVDLNDLTTSYNVINSAANINSNSASNHPFDIFDQSTSLVGAKNGRARTTNGSSANKIMVNSGNYYDGSGSESTSETLSSSIETNNNNNNSSSTRIKHLDLDLVE